MCTFRSVEICSLIGDPLEARFSVALLSYCRIRYTAWPCSWTYMFFIIKQNQYDWNQDEGHPKNLFFYKKCSSWATVWDSIFPSGVRKPVWITSQLFCILCWKVSALLHLDLNSLLRPADLFLGPPRLSKLCSLSFLWLLPLHSPLPGSGQSERLSGSGADHHGPEHHELGAPQGPGRGRWGRAQAQPHPAQPGLLPRLLPHPPVCG